MENYVSQAHWILCAVPQIIHDLPFTDWDTYLILDLVGLSLVARQGGPTLPHPVSDAHRRSWTV
jgi:hypothetical protein